MAVNLTKVPNTQGKPTEEKVNKILAYLNSLKRDVEYEIENAASHSTVSEQSLIGLFDEMGIDLKDEEFWTNIQNILNENGKVIGEKIQGNINDANILISSLKNKNILLMDGDSIEDSTWAMELSAAGFRIAGAKNYDADTKTYSWDWSTFGTGKGFTADEMTAGTINGLTIKACDMSATNITGGTIQGVAISGNTITGNTISGGSINGAEIHGNAITGGTIGAAAITGGTISAATIEAATVNASTFNTATLNAPAISAATITGGTITGNTITGGTITGSSITGSTVSAVGENGDGVLLKDIGYAVYGATADGAGEVAAYLQYDQEGRGTPDEAHKRVFLKTCNGYALKIESDGDMSIDAAGTIFQGDVTFSGTTNLGLVVHTSIEWKDDGCVIDGEHFLKITDTSIKCLDSNEEITISTSTGTTQAAYDAYKAEQNESSS